MDLVAAQLQIAGGASFATIRGGAFARLSATYPTARVGQVATVTWPVTSPRDADGMQPTSSVALQLRVVMDNPGDGAVLEWSESNGPGVRIDSALYLGYELPILYDPLLCKVCPAQEDKGEGLLRQITLGYPVLMLCGPSQLIVRGSSFEDARTRALRALRELRLAGPVTNRATLERILTSAEFGTHTFTTELLGQWAPVAPGGETGPAVEAEAAAMGWLRAQLADDATAAPSTAIRAIHVGAVPLDATDRSTMQLKVLATLTAQLATPTHAALELSTATGTVTARAISWNAARSLLLVVINGHPALLSVAPSLAGHLTSPGVESKAQVRKRHAVVLPSTR